MNIRDDGISTDLSTALSIKVDVKDPELGDPSAGVSLENSNSNVQKIYKSITSDSSQCYGGIAGYCDEFDSDKKPVPNSPKWVDSLTTNPAAANYELVRLDQLIIDKYDGEGKQQEVSDRIDFLLAQQELSRAKLLVIYKTMQYGADDSGSRAHNNLNVNVVTADDSWFTLGQYAQGPSPSYDFRKNPGYWKGIQIREAPQIEASAPNSILRKPTGYNQNWSRRSHGSKGLYEMTGDAGFAPLSSYFFRTDSISKDDFGSGVLVNKDYLIPVTSKYQKLWSSDGSNSGHASIWGVVDPNPYAANQSNLITKTSISPCYFFHSSGAGTDSQPDIAQYRLDFSHVTVLDDFFLSGLVV
jgi:hypothetical protein